MFLTSSGKKQTEKKLEHSQEHLECQQLIMLMENQLIGQMVIV